MTTPQLTPGRITPLLGPGLTTRESVLISKAFRLDAELRYTMEGKALVDKGLVAVTLSEEATERMEHCR